MYTKAILVDQVYLRVTGGQPSRDVDVRREDIQPFVAAAVRFFFRKQYYDYKRLDQVYGFDEVGLHTYTIAVSGEDRGFKTAELPVRPLNLPMGPAIDTVMPIEGEQVFVRIRGQQWLSGLDRMINTVFFWPEGKKLYFKNLGKSCDIHVRLIPDPVDLSDDAELRLPGGMDVEVIQLAVDFFTGQRLLPGDLAVNSTDDAAGQRG